MTRALFIPSRVTRDRPLSRRHSLGGAVAAAPASLARWVAPAALAAAIAAAALAVPSPARAGDDDLVRVLVDVADVVFRTGTPYYRDEYGRYERLLVVGGAYGPQYYRHLPRRGHYDRGWRDRDVKCNRQGKCKVKYTYYDPRHDRDRRDWGRDRDWRGWYGRHARGDDDRYGDRHRVRYRLIRAHGDD